MRTSTRISPRLGRLAGAAAILFVPLATLLVMLLARVDDTGDAGATLATLGSSVGADTALRLVVAAGLLAAGAVIGVTLARRR